MSVIPVQRFTGGGCAAIVQSRVASVPVNGPFMVIYQSPFDKEFVSNVFTESLVYKLKVVLLFLECIYYGIFSSTNDKLSNVKHEHVGLLSNWVHLYAIFVDEKKIYKSLEKYNWHNSEHKCSNLETKGLKKKNSFSILEQIVEPKHSLRQK